MELKGWKTRGELENCCHELSFLRWCYDTNPIIGLQAFRLFSEALYKQLIETEVDLDTKSKLNPIALKNYPTTPRNFPIKMYSNTNVAPK